jgi:hypothetical protein
MSRNVVLVFLSATAIVCGQAVVESAIITGAGATGTAGAAKGVGKGVGAVFGRVNAELNRAAKAGAPDGAKSTVALPATKPPAVSAEDVRSNLKADAVKVGMTRDELIALAGKPALAVASPVKDSELLCFVLKSGGSIDVVLTGGRVTEVTAQPN